MRAALLSVLALAPLAAAFTPIVIDIEFDQLTLELDHGSMATPVVAIPFPASSGPALSEEEELKIHWEEPPDFDPVALLKAQEAAAVDATGGHIYASEAGKLPPPGGMLSAAAGAVMDIL